MRSSSDHFVAILPVIFASRETTVNFLMIVMQSQIWFVVIIYKVLVHMGVDAGF